MQVPLAFLLGVCINTSSYVVRELIFQTENQECPAFNYQFHIPSVL